MAEIYTARIDPELNIAVISASGKVTPEGFYDAQDQLLENELWRSDTDLLIVLEDDVSLEAISFNKLAKFAAPFQAWTLNHRRAPHPLTAVVCRKTIFDLARHFWNTIKQDDWLVEVALTRSENEAMDWIHERRASRLATA